MDLIIFSGCIKSLNDKLMKTSSEKFEYEFASNLALHGNIKVTVYSAALDFGEIQHSYQMSLIGIKGETQYSTFKNLSKLIGHNEERTKLILFYGYDLFIVLNFIYIKLKYKIVMLCFVFDTHVASIENYKPFKKFIVDRYFKLAIKFLRILDGYLLFQKDAAKELNLRKAYHVTKPGIDKRKINSYIYSRNSKDFTITYMGSLMHYNGINEILHSFAMCDDPDLRLRIFGTGNLQKEVAEYEKKDKRIYYGGLVDQNVISDELKNTDLLLNLRNPMDYVCKFAYPSKLIEYMATGIPVLSTDLKFTDEMKDCLYTISNLDSGEIISKIDFIKNDDIGNKTIKVERAKQYIINNNSWEKICKDLIIYIEGFKIEQP